MCKWSNAYNHKSVIFAANQLFYVKKVMLTNEWNPKYVGN